MPRNLGSVGAERKLREGQKFFWDKAKFHRLKGQMQPKIRPGGNTAEGSLRAEGVMVKA